MRKRQDLLAGEAYRRGAEVPMLCLTGSETTAVCRRIDKLLHGLGHMGPVTHAALVNRQLLHFMGIDEPTPQHAAMRLPVHQTALASSLAVCA